MKSLFSRFIAFVLFIFCVPLLLLVGICILLAERKTIIFKQQRLGLEKKIFTIYKLRTMTNGKITFIGRILRKTGIDELPQLINIIKGDICFIGPRPLTQLDVERLGWTEKIYDTRWHVKPGLTGLAQLSPICHKKMTFFWDSYYAKHKSFLLDYKIVLASSLTIILGKAKVKSIIQKRLKK